MTVIVRVSVLLSLLAVATPIRGRAQAALEAGIGPSVSTRPTWAWGDDLTFGLGAIVRWTSVTSVGSTGLEMVGSFSRGEEYSASGFPPPNAQPPPPRRNSVVLSRIAINAVVQVSTGEAVDLKLGVGVASVQAIQECDCLDAVVRSRESRVGPVVTFGVGRRRDRQSPLRLRPSLDFVFAPLGGATHFLVLSVGSRWTR